MEAIGLLSFGTFLEYFDLMLYMHMSVLLNDLFFPKSDPTTAKLLAATAFCSTYVIRPIGGFIIGRIGDIMGRKFTIMLTTFVMAISCLIIAGTPTYEEIGLTASILMVISRMVQGVSSLAEIMGAQIYLSENLKTPYRCIAAGIPGVFAQIGGLTALICASFVMNMGLNWRIIFILGAVVAVIGLLARTRLRETSDFINYKYKLQKNKLYTNDKVSKKKF